MGIRDSNVTSLATGDGQTSYVIPATTRTDIMMHAMQDQVLAHLIHSHVTSLALAYLTYNFLSGRRCMHTPWLLLLVVVEDSLSPCLCTSSTVCISSSNTSRRMLLMLFTDCMQVLVPVNPVMSLPDGGQTHPSDDVATCNSQPSNARHKSHRRRQQC